MKGEKVNPTNFKLAAATFKTDAKLSKAFTQLHKLTKSPAKEARADKANTVQAYKQRIADAKSVDALQIIAGEIQRDSALSDSQATTLDDVVFEAQDALEAVSQPKNLTATTADKTDAKSVKTAQNCTDLLGESTQSKQAVAYAERAKDVKRNTGTDNANEFNLTGSDSKADKAIAAGAQSLFSRRIHGEIINKNDFVVPETSDFEGNMDGTLAYTPISAIKTGIEQLPIKLTVGVAKGQHRGFGLTHISDNNRSVPKYTDDLAENYAQHVAKIAKTFDVIYSEGDRLVFKSTKLKDALVVQKVKDENNGDFYSIVTLRPAIENVWGKPDWVSRVAQPTDRLLQSRAAYLSPNDNLQRLGRQSLRSQSSKLNVNDLKATSQEKSAGGATVTYKKRRTFSMREVSFSRAPTFYSAFIRAIDNIQTKKADPKMWQGLIRNLAQKGVKPDEIEWTGINDWLALQTSKVTKEQVLEYLNSNGLETTKNKFVTVLQT